jgi:hypothetical protein
MRPNSRKNPESGQKQVDTRDKIEVKGWYKKEKCIKMKTTV